MYLLVGIRQFAEEAFKREGVDFVGEEKKDSYVEFIQGTGDKAKKIRTHVPDGYELTKHKSQGQKVFTDGKDFISPDTDGHGGGIWKKAKKVQQRSSGDIKELRQSLTILEKARFSPHVTEMKYIPGANPERSIGPSFQTPFLRILHSDCNNSQLAPEGTLPPM